MSSLRKNVLTSKRNGDVSAQYVSAITHRHTDIDPRTGRREADVVTAGQSPNQHT